MSEKLENALNGLIQSVENFEKKFIANQSAKPTPIKHISPQNDLFGLSQDTAVAQKSTVNVNSKAMAAVLDRTIQRMEKLVGENS